jgi:hypothetical protein
MAASSCFLLRVLCSVWAWTAFRNSKAYGTPGPQRLSKNSTEESTATSCQRQASTEQFELKPAEVEQNGQRFM